MTKPTIIALTVFLGLAATTARAQQKLTPELLWKLGRISEPQVSPDGRSILYGVTHYSIEENKGNRELYSIPVAGGTANRLTNTPKSEQNALWRPDGKKIAYMSAEGGSMQVWEINPDGSGKQQVSSVTDGIDGFTYAPDMKSIVYIKSVKLDKTPSDIYPDLTKTEGRIIDGLNYRHWNAWDDYSYSHVFIATYTDGKMAEGKDIMKDEHYDSPLQPMGGMEQIAISPNGKLIAYTCRKQHGTAEATSTNADIYLYDIEKATTTNITDGLNGYDINPSFSHDGQKLSWLSMATAAYESDKNRLFIYDLNTKQEQGLTASLDQGVDEMQWSKDDKLIYFISSVKATQQLYNVELKTGKITQMTEGLHDLNNLSLADKEFICTKTTLSMPAEIYKVDASGKQLTQLTFENKELLKDLKMGKVEQRYLTATDGKKLQTWIIYPPDFNPKKKYPTLLYCQGGPQGAISQSFSYRWNFQLMAANGYIVVAPNRRGVTSFGQEWTDAIAGDWGGQAIRDYLTAIDSVSAQPYVDKEKMGAVGASYGGYSVYYLAGIHNKRFKAFISHCGLYDTRSWYGSTEEYFFANHDMKGAYWDNPNNKSYTDFNPSTLVKNWDTPILVIHNQLDYRVPLEQGLQAFNAAQLRGIPSKLLYFPDEGHWVMKPQNSLLWNRVFFDWLDKYLK